MINDVGGWPILYLIFTLKIPLTFIYFCDHKYVDVSFTMSQNLLTTSNHFDVLFVVFLLIFLYIILLKLNFIVDHIRQQGPWRRSCLIEIQKIQPFSQPPFLQQRIRKRRAFHPTRRS